MRFESIDVGPIQDQARITFHPRLTVVGGLGDEERTELARLLVGTLSGDLGESAAARLVDSTGARLNGSHGPAGWSWVSDEGRPCVAPASILTSDRSSLKRLMLLTSADLGTTRSDPVEGDSPELAEARTTLGAIENELAKALDIQHRVDALRTEVADIDARLRTAETDTARRRYGRLLADLERLQIELASIQGGSNARDDKGLVVAAPEVHALAARWRQAVEAVLVERDRFGSRERLDVRTLNDALRTPDEVPPELEALAAIWEAALAQRSLLADRLSVLARGALPQPNHPAVVRLAHADQDSVWATARRANEAAHRLETQSLALGGLEAEGVAPTAAHDLERAHDAVDLAERELHRRRVAGLVGTVTGLVFCLLSVVTTMLLILLGVGVVAGAAVWAVVVPTRELTRRQEEEADALQRAGVASYISFQMRRLEVNIDPKATEPLELAALEYRRALAAWRKIGGDLSPLEALELEPETRAYTTALSGSRDAANEIAEVRHQLTTVAEPAVEKARARLTAACEPFGIDDPQLAVDLVRHQAGTSAVARLQAALESAEAREQGARAELEDRLSTFGFAGTPTPAAGIVPADAAEIDRRLHAFDTACTAAGARERARAESRPAHLIESELARVEALVDAEAGAEWTLDVRAGDEPDPDLDQMRLRQFEAHAELEAARADLPDIGRLTDRRDAIERRVAVLAANAGSNSSSAVVSADLEQMLLARLAAARRVGAHGEGVTVVLDEPFVTVKGDRKWAILDAVERLSASVQLVYLTDDVDVLVWARQRGPAGAISLLEPARELA